MQKLMIMSVIICAAGLSLFSQELSTLRVSDDKHYLVTEIGEPFFWLGDTAWELFHRLDREETEMYLENRRQKGFTVIQAVALAELDGLNTPNAYGDRPFIDNNPAKPDTSAGADIDNDQQYDYWDHVEWVIDLAASKGIYIGLLPTWGDKVTQKWGVGPVIFNEDNAAIYGDWIGKRYRWKKNIIWIMGGDRNPVDDLDYRPVWRAMANAIKSVDPEKLMTYHPMGYATSSQWFKNDDWFDFSMIQSSHSTKAITNYTFVQTDYKQTPVKPVLDGEAAYEDHPINWDPQNGWFDELDVRRGAYMAIFAGAFGHTYGCHDIWQMYAPGRQPISSARTFWYDALDLPGTFDMTIMRNFLESRPMLDRFPDQSLIDKKKQGSGTTRIQATRSNDYAFIYFATGTTVKINLGILSGTTLTTWWMNPATGDTLISQKIANSGTVEVTCPDLVNDWVLVLENSELYYTSTKRKPSSDIADFVLYSNYPNPFNASTSIRYSLAKACHVKVQIFNLLGQSIKVLVDEGQTTGVHAVTFAGEQLSSGCYIYQVTADHAVKSGKMVLLN